ncbi:MAG: ADP-heptose synthase / D-glycero-beta-D-manno-heptose 7-phosphate kinase, partial [uncultured Nocardioidaceae bacterium]
REHRPCRGRPARCPARPVLAGAGGRGHPRRTRRPAFLRRGSPHPGSGASGRGTRLLWCRGPVLGERRHRAGFRSPHQRGGPRRGAGRRRVRRSRRGRCPARGGGRHPHSSRAGTRRPGVGQAGHGVWHRGGDGGLLRPAARGPHRHLASRAAARGPPGRLRELRRVGTTPQGAVAPAGTRGGPGAGARGAGVRGLGRGLRRGHPCGGAARDPARCVGEGRRLRGAAGARVHGARGVGRPVCSPALPERALHDRDRADGGLRRHRDRDNEKRRAEM